MEISSEEATGHLSNAAQRFLTYVTGAPERTRNLDHLAAGEFFTQLQSWPTFVGGQKLAEIRHATVALTQLVKSIPERIFDNDPRRIAAFFGFPNETSVGLILMPPNGLDSVLVRNDYIDTPDGFKCLEVNSGQIGGWQLRYFEQRVRAHPVVARFLAEAGITPYYRDPVTELLKFIIDHNLGKPTAASGALNVGITMSDLTAAESEGARLTRTYRDLLAAGGAGLTGEVVLCSCADLARRQDQIWYRDRLPIHALVLMSEEVPPEIVFRIFKSGRLSLYNGPVSQLFSDKRTLALLSERASSSLFTTEERNLLARTLPWTRTVAPGEAAYRGETRPLPDLLLARREDFVLKPARGNKGQGVTFGRATPPALWERVVAEAVRSGGWLAQERVDSRPYVYQQGEQGYGEHDVVWGTFCFGESYGGGFLRMVPRGRGDRAINAALGASEGLLFEV